MAQVSSRSNVMSDATRKSAEQRVMLIGLALGLSMIGLCAAIRLCSWIAAPVASPAALETLPVCDVMLLTPEEREQARRTNVGSYTFDGTYYVNASLPEEYWTEWRSIDG